MIVLTDKEANIVAFGVVVVIPLITFIIAHITSNIMIKHENKK